MKIGDTVKIIRGFDQKFEGMVGKLLKIKKENLPLKRDSLLFEVKLHEHNYVWCRGVEKI